MGDKVLPFAEFWAINSLVLFVFSLIWPGFIVFGNAAINPAVAVIWTGFILTVAGFTVRPILDQLKIKIENEIYLGGVYLATNIFVLWILARLAQNLTGFGISAFYVAIVAGIVVNFAQWGFWKLSARKSIKKAI